MKRIVTLVALLGLVGSLAWAGPEDGTETVTVEGEVLDLGCYASREAKGPDHQACAARCLKNGNPAGLLDADGRVFTLAAASPAYTDYAALTVRITGSLRGNLLRPTSMSVWDDGAWKDVAMTKFGAPETASE